MRVQAQQGISLKSRLPAAALEERRLLLRHVFKKRKITVCHPRAGLDSPGKLAAQERPLRKHRVGNGSPSTPRPTTACWRVARPPHFSLERPELPPHPAVRKLSSTQKGPDIQPAARATFLRGRVQRHFRGGALAGVGEGRPAPRSLTRAAVAELSA